MRRNPFVNQVFVVRITHVLGHYEETSLSRNPFVNQVFVVAVLRPKGRMGISKLSQSLRKSGLCRRTCRNVLRLRRIAVAIPS